MLTRYTIFHHVHEERCSNERECVCAMYAGTYMKCKQSYRWICFGKWKWFRRSVYIVRKTFKMEIERGTGKCWMFTLRAYLFVILQPLIHLWRVSIFRWFHWITFGFFHFVCFLRAFFSCMNCLPNGKREAKKWNNKNVTPITMMIVKQTDTHSRAPRLKHFKFNTGFY